MGARVLVTKNDPDTPKRPRVHCGAAVTVETGAASCGVSARSTLPQFTASVGSTGMGGGSVCCRHVSAVHPSRSVAPHLLAL